MIYIKNRNNLYLILCILIFFSCDNYNEGNNFQTDKNEEEKEDIKKKIEEKNKLIIQSIQTTLEISHKENSDKLYDIIDKKVPNGLGKNKTISNVINKIKLLPYNKNIALYNQLKIASKKTYRRDLKKLKKIELERDAETIKNILLNISNPITKKNIYDIIEKRIPYDLKEEDRNPYRIKDIIKTIDKKESKEILDKVLQKLSNIEKDFIDTHSTGVLIRELLKSFTNKDYLKKLYDIISNELPDKLKENEKTPEIIEKKITYSLDEDKSVMLLKKIEKFIKKNKPPVTWLESFDKRFGKKTLTKLYKRKLSAKNLLWQSVRGEIKRKYIKKGLFKPFVQPLIEGAVSFIPGGPVAKVAASLLTSLFYGLMPI